MSIWGSASAEWNSNVTLFQSSPFLTALAPGGTNTIVPTDDQWLGPVTLNVSTPIDVPASSRLIISGNIDDATNMSAVGSDLVKIGQGELMLSGANTYRGTTYVGTTSTPATPGYDPDGVDEVYNGGNTIAGGVVTVASNQALGAAGTPTVQTVTLTGAVATGANQTFFTLQFNGDTTNSLPYTGVAATDIQTIQNALNGLASVGGPGNDPGGLVTVAEASPGVFTVTFSGSLVGFSQPAMLPLITNGSGTIGVTVAAAGTGGVVVQNGSSLQLESTITIAGKTLEMSGTGFNGSVPLAVPNWAQVGPAPVSNGPTINGKTAATLGRITGIATDPTDPETIYVSTAGGGAWKTQNGGQTWVPLFDNSASEFSGAIAIAPNNSQVIYLGTGEADNSTDSYAGTGVYMSTDGGHSWTLLTDKGSLSNPLNGLAVSSIAVDSGNSSLIYVATSDQATNASATAIPGIWRFDGTTWTNLTAIVSTNRENVVGTTAVTKVAAPKDPGPDDNYLYGFPQQNVTWSSVAVFGSAPTRCCTRHWAPRTAPAPSTSIRSTSRRRSIPMPCTSRSTRPLRPAASRGTSATAARTPRPRSSTSRSFPTRATSS